MKITTKHASDSPVTFVTHKRFVVLFFLPSCCVHSLRSLISRRLQGKTPLCGPFFENLQFWFKRRKKSFSFQNYPGTCGLTLLSFSSSRDWDRDNMKKATNWRANLKTELTNGRPATGEHPRNLICCVFPCKLHAHFGLSTDVLYFLCERTK